MSRNNYYLGFTDESESEVIKKICSNGKQIFGTTFEPKRSSCRVCAFGHWLLWNLKSPYNVYLVLEFVYSTLTPIVCAGNKGMLNKNYVESGESAPYSFYFRSEVGSNFSQLPPEGEVERWQVLDLSRYLKTKISHSIVCRQEITTAHKYSLKPPVCSGSTPHCCSSFPSRFQKLRYKKIFELVQR